jgi:hypothetical protein
MLCVGQRLSSTTPIPRRRARRGWEIRARCCCAGALVVRDTGAIVVATAEHHSPASGRRRDRGVRRSGCRETISTPAARTASAGSTVTSQPTTETGSWAKVRAVARPMLQSVSVTMQSSRTSRPDISVGPGGRSGGLLRLGNPPSRCAWDLVEVLIDDVARRSGERRCSGLLWRAPTARWPCGARSATVRRRRRPRTGDPCPGAASASVRKPCRSRWRGWIVHRSDHSRRTRPCRSRHWTRCGSRDSDALVTSASELIRMVRCGFVESMPRTRCSTIRRFESRCSC